MLGYVGYVGYVERFDPRKNRSRTCRSSGAVTCNSARSYRSEARGYPAMGFRALAYAWRFFVHLGLTAPGQYRDRAECLGALD